MDDLTDEQTKRYIHHATSRRILSASHTPAAPARREIGRRAVKRSGPVLPSLEGFPPSAVSLRSWLSSTSPGFHLRGSPWL